MAIADVVDDAGISDYGSDLDAEQEDLINQFLGGTSDIPESTPPLLIRDIEDNEGPSGAKVPSVLVRNRVSHYRPSLSEDYSSHPSSATVQVQFDRGDSAQGEVPHKDYHSALLIDVQASSRKSRKP